MLVTLVVGDAVLLFLAICFLLRRLVRGWAWPDGLGLAEEYRFYISVAAAGVMLLVFLAHIAVLAGWLIDDGPPDDVVEITVEKFGRGAIESSVPGLVCLAGCDLRSASVPRDQRVTLSAVAASATVSWSGCDTAVGTMCEVTSRADSTVVATFATDVEVFPDDLEVLDLDEEPIAGRWTSQGSRFIFSDSSPQAAALVPGDLIVGGTQRFFREVTTAPSESDAGITVDTKEVASLKGKIWKGTVPISNDLFARLSEEDLLAGEESMIDGASCDLRELSCTVELKTVVGDLPIEGTVFFDLDLDIGVDYFWFWVREVRAIAEFTTKAEIAIDADSEIAPIEPLAIDLATVPFTIPAGPIPIPAKLTLQLTIGIEGQLTEASVDLTAETHVKLGGRYVNGRWEKVESPGEPRFDLKAGTDGEVTAFVEPKLILNIAGFGGPDFAVNGGLQLKVDTSLDPRWLLYWVLEASPGIDMNFFGLNVVDENLPPWGWRWPIRPPSAEPRPTFNITSTPTPTATSTPGTPPAPPTPRTPTRTPTATSTPTPTAPPVLLGDVDCNNEVNSLDALWILQLHAGEIASLDCEDGADVNCDGPIDSFDAEEILQIDGGLVDSPASCEVPAAFLGEIAGREARHLGPPAPSGIVRT